MPGNLKIAKIMSIYQMVRQNGTAKNRSISLKSQQKS